MERPLRPDAQGGEGLDLKRYLRVLDKRKWLVLLFFLATLVAVAVYTRKQTPIYRGTVKVLIERNPPRVLTGTAEVVELGNTNYWSNKEYYQTQYNIIRSRAVCRRVVERLGLQSDPRFLDAWDEAHPSRDGRRPPTVDELADALSKRIQVEPLQDSWVVLVHIEDPDPELAMELANAVAQAYSDYNLDRKENAVSAADRELKELVAERRKAKEKAEMDVVEFERRVHLGTLDNEKKVVSQALISGEAELESLRRRIDATRARLVALKKVGKAPDPLSVGLPEFIKSPFILDLKGDYVRVQRELEEAHTRYLDKHPVVVALERQLRTMRQAARKELHALKKAAANELSRLELQRDELAKRLDEYRKRDAELAMLQVDYDRLVALREQARAAYDKVQRRLIETKMTGEIRVNNVAILDAARKSTVPVRPNMRLNLLLGALLGLFGGVAFAFAVEFFDNTVKGREDVEEAVGLTFLGMVPRVRHERRGRHAAEEKPYEGPPELYVHYRPMSTVAEFSRSIRTNLLFMSPDQPLRCLLVTSPSPQEGKTTFAINLGINMAASGGKTVIVDTDMRRPRLHSTFEVSNHRGVSNYLIGKDPITEFVQSTEVPNLDLLPCGPRPPNPAELLHTERFAELIEELKQHYATIIFDSPPVNLVTDALVIATQADGVVVLAKYGKTTREALRHTRRQLETVNARVLGCVLNDLDLERKGYGYYYAGRYYGYRYGDSRSETPGS